MYNCNLCGNPSQLPRHASCAFKANPWARRNARVRKPATYGEIKSTPLNQRGTGSGVTAESAGVGRSSNTSLSTFPTRAAAAPISNASNITVWHCCPGCAAAVWCLKYGACAKETETPLRG